METDIYTNLQILHNSLQERIGVFLHEHGTDLSCLPCLEYAFSNGGCTASEMAQRLGEERAVINRRLARLSARGFICKKPGKRDSRSNLLFATPAGKAVLEGVREIVDQWDRQMRSLIGEEDFLFLRNTVRKMSDAVPNSVRQASDLFLPL